MPSLPNAPHKRRVLPRTHARQKAPNEPRAARSARHERGRAAGGAEAVQRATQGVFEDRPPGISRDQGAGSRVGEGGYDGADTSAAGQDGRRTA